MEKYKKSSKGKKAIHEIVTQLLMELNLVNPDDDWTEEKRQELENQLYETIAQSVVKFVEEIASKDEGVDLHQNNEFNQSLFEEFQPEWEAHGDKFHGEWSNKKHGKFIGYDFK